MGIVVTGRVLDEGPGLELTMTDQTRQKLRIVFLAGVLGLSVGAGWLFAAHRRAQVTALSEPIRVEGLGFSISMPKGWQRIDARRWRLANTLVYTQPLEPAVYDSDTQRAKQRRIFFIAIPPNASDAQTLAPLRNLAAMWTLTYNYGGSFALEPLGAPRFDSVGNEHREAVIAFRRGRSRFILMRYEQIKAQGRVFWCVMAGNTQLNEADRALLEAVASSLELLGKMIQRSDQS